MVSSRHFWALGYPMHQAPNAFSLLQSPFLIFLFLLISSGFFWATLTIYVNLLLSLSAALFVWNSVCVAFFEWEMIYFTWVWDSHGSLLSNPFSFWRNSCTLYARSIFSKYPHTITHTHACTHTQTHTFILFAFLCHLFLFLSFLVFFFFCSTHYT